MSSQSSVLPRERRAYVGNELDLFAQAKRWKRYLASHLAPYLTGDVLEVGAGIGALTGPLHGGANEQAVKCLQQIGNAKNVMTVGAVDDAVANGARSLDPAAIDAIGFCSVVPDLNHSLVNACRRYFDIDPFVLREVEEPRLARMEGRTVDEDQRGIRGEHRFAVDARQFGQRLHRSAGAAAGPLVRAAPGLGSRRRHPDS